MADEPTTNVRLASARWLVAKLRPAMPTTHHGAKIRWQVEPGWPGAQLDRLSLWVDVIDGPQDLPVSVDGRLPRDDEFVIPLEMRTQAQSLDEAADLLSAGVGTVEDLMAENHTMNDEVPGVLLAYISRERALCARDPEAIKGFARVEISVRARLV